MEALALLQLNGVRPSSRPRSITFNMLVKDLSRHGDRQVRLVATSRATPASRRAATTFACSLGRPHGRRSRHGLGKEPRRSGLACGRVAPPPIRVRGRYKNASTRAWARVNLLVLEPPAGTFSFMIGLDGPCRVEQMEAGGIRADRPRARPSFGILVWSGVSASTSPVVAGYREAPARISTKPATATASPLLGVAPSRQRYQRDVPGIDRDVRGRARCCTTIGSWSVPRHPKHDRTDAGRLQARSHSATPHPPLVARTSTASLPRIWRRRAGSHHPLPPRHS